MKLRLKNHYQVRVFSILFTLGALSGNLLLLRCFLPVALFTAVVFPGAIVAVILAAPISFYIGVRMLDVHELTEKLEHAVNHDHLTGTCTRSSFYRHLKQMDDIPLVIIVTDIDHFKRINDEHSHQAGDIALKQFAITLQRSCRKDDLVARFGGEEFIILLKNTTLDDGVEIAQRLCDCVRKKIFFAEGKKLHLTASFGVAEVKSTNEVDDAFHKADLAAFRAKREGRDRVCKYDPTLDDGPSNSQSAA